jgi:hypothetical protein
VVCVVLVDVVLDVLVEDVEVLLVVCVVLVDVVLDVLVDDDVEVELVDVVLLVLVVDDVLVDDVDVVLVECVVLVDDEVVELVLVGVLVDVLLVELVLVDEVVGADVVVTSDDDVELLVEEVVAPGFFSEGTQRSERRRHSPRSAVRSCSANWSTTEIGRGVNGPPGAIV